MYTLILPLEAGVPEMELKKRYNLSPASRANCTAWTVLFNKDSLLIVCVIPAVLALRNSRDRDVHTFFLASSFFSEIARNPLKNQDFCSISAKWLSALESQKAF